MNFQGEMYLSLMAKVVTNQVNPENGVRIKYLLDRLVPEWPDERRKELVGELVRLRSVPDDWWTGNLAFPFSMIGPRRMHQLRHAASRVVREGIPGDMVETGVWRGGACIMMKAVIEAYGDTDRKVWVCDSFRGLPKANGIDEPIGYLHDHPLLSVPMDDVKSHFERLGLLDERVRFVSGEFKDTMPVLADSGPDQISILRLDGDYYSSTMDVLTNLYDKVSRGGYVIVDDYGSYPQCAKAVDDFREERGLNRPLVQIDGKGVYWRVSAT